MGWADLFFGTALVGATAIGIGAALKSGKKEKQRRLLEEAEEERRQNIPCKFNNGIDENDFARIIKSTSKQFRRIKSASTTGAEVNIKYCSQSGITQYWASIDFNDYGEITGKYWINNENSDSNIPKAFADAISENIQKGIDKFHQGKSNGDSHTVETLGEKTTPKPNNSVNNDFYRHNSEKTFFRFIARYVDIN